MPPPADSIDTARGFAMNRTMSEDGIRGVVEVPYQGGLGNRLSQYCVGRILATELGFDLEAEAIPGFPGVVSLREGTAREVSDSDALTLTGHRLDLAGAGRRREHPADRRARALLPLRHLPPLQGGHPRRLAGDRAAAAAGARRLTIHVRAGDIWQSSARGPVRPDHPALPFSFYADIVRAREWRKVVVVSEDPADPMVKKLAATLLRRGALGQPARRLPAPCRPARTWCCR